MAISHTIGGYQVPDRVLSAVREASAATGMDFSYMMAKAARESGFDADIRASTSSATGLYQFIDQTWLGMVKAHGAEHGLGRYADRIVERTGGGYTVHDSALRQEILDLRTDPRLNALMAGEYANDNQAHLERSVGGDIGPTELYLAHFLGAGGASDFLNEMRRNPGRAAADLFPAAAEANRAVFYDRASGRPRTLEEVYANFDSKVASDMAMAESISPGEFQDIGPTLWRPLRNPSPLIEEGGVFDPFRMASTAPLEAPTPPMAGDRNLSLWTVLTLSSLPVPGEKGQDGIADFQSDRMAGTLFG